MKLYYSPGACSLSPHIVLRESGLPFDIVPANLQTHKLTDGADFYAVNAKGYVPVLELDTGERLTEGPVIVQYIADLVPARQLAPANGTMARYRVQEWLSFITSEIHKSYAPIFNPTTPTDYKPIAADRVKQRLGWVDTQLEGKSYLMGDAFSVADAYLFTVASWAPHVRIDLSALTHLNAFIARMASRPAVQAALKAEGLLK